MTVRSMKTWLPMAVGLLVGTSLAIAGPRYLAAGTHSYVGDYSYPAATQISYVGDLWGYRGHDANLVASLVDAEGAPVAREWIGFSLGNIRRYAMTDSSGMASVRVRLDLVPRAYDVLVSFDGDNGSSPSTDHHAFEVRWEHSFADDLGSGSIHLNPSTKEFMVETPGRTSDIHTDGDMREVAAAGRRLVVVDHTAPGIGLRGEFELRSGSFTAVVTMDGNTYVLTRSPI